MTKHKYGKANICIICARTARDCVWLRYGEPVPGWRAKRVPYAEADGKVIYTYAIRTPKDCPRYKQGRKEAKREYSRK